MLLLRKAGGGGGGGAATAIGSALTGATPGSILFAGAGGVLAQDNTNLFWDAANARLGIGTATPNNKLHIPGLLSFDDAKFNVNIGSGNAPAQTTGTRNLTVGRRCLELNQTGNNNVALGDLTLNKYLGSDSVAVGAMVLLNDVSAGVPNIGMGTQALGANTTGQANIAVGHLSMLNNTTGQYNAAVGAGALQKNTTGSSNVALGQSAMLNNTTGGYNMAIGSGALQSSTTGSENVCIGTNAGKNNVGAGENFFLGTSCGYGAVGSTGQSNVVIGKDNMTTLTTGSHNVAIGKGAMNNSTSATSNAVIGDNAGTQMKTGTGNAALGSLAGTGFLDNNQSFNTFVGNWAGAFGSGNNIVAVGNRAGQGCGASCVMIGNQAGQNEAGTGKLYIANTNTATPLIHGDFANKNLGFSTTDYAGGVGVQALANATTIPAATPVGGGVFYSSGGALYWKGSAGTVTMVAAA